MDPVQNSDGESYVSFSLRPVSTKRAPVKLVQILLNDREIPLDTPVAVSGSWIGKIRLVVQNISPKAIVAGTATLLYDETGDSSRKHPTFSSPLSLGRLPATAFRQKDGTMRPITQPFLEHPQARIEPGQTMEFQLSPSQADVDQREAYSESKKISRVSIQLQSYYFDDGSKWTGSSYLVPVDPPDLWREVSVEEFFGEKLSGGH